MLTDELAARIREAMRRAESGETQYCLTVRRIGSIGGLPVYAEPCMPKDELRIVDMRTGDVLGTITGLTVEEG